MNTTTSAVATATLVTIGLWADDQQLDVGVVVGGAISAIALAMLPDELAGKFATIMLVVAAFNYVPVIGWRAGFIGGSKPKPWLPITKPVHGTSNKITPVTPGK